VRLLAVRSRSEAELRRLLRPRMSAPGALDQAVLRLRDRGYLDDGRFAESFARFRREAESHGRARVLRDLRARGVDAPTADAAVGRAYAGAEEGALVAEYLRRKRIAPPADRREAASVFRRLLHAGFSSAAAIAALKKWRLDPEWLDQMAEAADSAHLPDES
jgi:regulatory protein